MRTEPVSLEHGTKETQTFCDVKTMCTSFDEVKRKVTKL